MIRFDTRNKKPKVWNIAVLTVGFVVVEGILMTRNPVSMPAVSAVLAVYLAVSIVFLLTAFLKQLQYNPYSYNTIYYMGFTIFLAEVLVSLLVCVGGLLSIGAEGMEAIRSILYNLLGSAKQYMLYTMPFILVYSALLCISNIQLIRNEGRRLVNLLGIILAFLLVGGELFLLFSDYYVSGSLEDIIRHELLINLFAALYLYFECMLIGTIIASMIVVRYEPDPDKDFLIILGCGIRKDGTPTPLLAGRINRALQFAEKQIKATGKAPVFVTSGGQGPNEVVSESEAMKQYLLAKGVPEERIIEENRSTSTRENMLFSKEKILAVKPDGKVAFSTTNYHIFRSGLMARRVKMRAVGMGAKTRWYFWPNAAVREFVGILTEHRLKQTLILGSMIAIYVVSTVVLYTWF